MSDLILEIVEGPGAGRQADLGQPLEIGRDPGAGLVLDDDQVSRRHARITPATGGAIVEDLGSLNGTFVNGNEIHAPTRLDPDDQLLVGVTVLQLRTSRQVAAQPSAVRPIPAALARPPATPDYLPPDITGTVPDTSPLDPLLDTYTKARARAAPFVIGAIVTVTLVALVLVKVLG